MSPQQRQYLMAQRNFQQRMAQQQQRMPTFQPPNVLPQQGIFTLKFTHQNQSNFDS